MDNNYSTEEELKANKYFVPLFLMAAIILIIGTTYAVWTILHSAKETNAIQTGCFNTTFTEGSSGINLTDAFPINDDEGFLTNPYTFTIENTCSLTASYKVNLESLEETDLPLSDIKISIDNEDPILLSSLIDGTKTIDNSLAAKELKKGRLTAGSSKTYSIRLWIAENATLSSAANKVYKGKIAINTQATK